MGHRPSRASYKDRADRRPPPKLTLNDLMGLPPDPPAKEQSFDDLFGALPTQSDEKRDNPLAVQLEKVLEDAGAQLSGELSADVAVAMVEVMAKEFRRDFATSDLSIMVRIMVEAGEEKIRRLRAAREES